MKMLKFLMVFVFAFVMMAMTVSAVNVNITKVEINDNEVDIAVGHTDNLEVRRGEKLEIEVGVKALADVEDVEIEAGLYGYKYSDYELGSVYDRTESFDLDENDTSYKDLELKVPTKMDKDYYKLRIRVSDRDGIAFENVYELHIKGIDDDDAIVIKDFSISPDSVKPGRGFTALVKVKNIGDDDLDDLKVTLSVPELGIKDSEYLDEDELEADETYTFEELLLRVPDDAEAGIYDVEVTVEFDEYESTVAHGEIEVLEEAKESEQESAKTIINVPGSQEITPGTTGGVYPIMITNTADEARTYTLSVEGISWGTYSMDPSNVVIVSGEDTETVYLYVSADEAAAAGEKVFIVNVATDGDSQEIPLKANIKEPVSAGWGNLKEGLEITLVVLVIILIIVGLIVGFTKLRGKSASATDEEASTYY
jgi:uncharacterized membrane protein